MPSVSILTRELELGSALFMGARDPRAASQIMHWWVTASKADCPSIFPPGEMQNSIECPIFCSSGICLLLEERMPVAPKWEMSGKIGARVMGWECGLGGQ